MALALALSVSTSMGAAAEQDGGKERGEGLTAGTAAAEGITEGRIAGGKTEASAELGSEEDVTIEEEDERKRGEYEKHFRNSDGSYTAVTYGDAVHYQKEDGSWEEIDNRLERVTEGNGERRLRNRDGVLDVSFGERPGLEMVTISRGGHEISLDLLKPAQEALLPAEPLGDAAALAGAGQGEEALALEENEDEGKREVRTQEETGEKGRKPEAGAGQIRSDEIPQGSVASQKKVLEVNEEAVARVKGPEAAGNSEEEEKTMALKASGELVFDDALGEKTDIEYVVTASQVKENIVMEDAGEAASYPFRLKTELEAELGEDRSVTLTDEEGGVVFYLPAPYMYDSGDGVSEAVEVTLEETEGGYLLTYTPDETWLKSEERVYPVTVDPTVTTSTNANTIKDRTVKAEGTCPYNEGYLYVGMRNDQNHITYIRHTNMPTVPANALIVKAVERLKVNSMTASTVRLDASWVIDAWDSTTLTWSNRPTGMSIFASDVGVTTSGTEKYYDIDLTEIAGYWYYNNNTNATNSTYPNYGYQLTERSRTGSVKLHSGDAAAVNVPKITITYYPAVTVTEGTYFIKNEMFGEYLDVKDGRVVSQTEVQIHSYNGSAAQQWEIESAGNGHYRIKSKLAAPAGNQYNLSVQWGSDYNNASIVMWLNPGSQTFTFHQRVGGQYYIKPWNSRRRVVDANNGSDAVLRGQRVQLWDSSLYKTNQQWSLESAELHVVTAAADLGPLLISDGPSGWTTVPYVQIQMQISYIKVGNNKLIQQIVTRVEASQTIPNILGSQVFVNSIYDKVGGIVYGQGEYTQREAGAGGITFYVFRRPINRLFTGSVEIECRFEVGNTAHTFLPKVCSATYTLT